MKGMLIPVDGEPKEIDIEQDNEGSTLDSFNVSSAGTSSHSMSSSETASASMSTRKGYSHALPIVRFMPPSTWRILATYRRWISQLL